MLAAVAIALLAASLLAGCTRDKSRLTSPSAKALLGVTTPTLLAFSPPGEPPAPRAAPAGWRLTADLARFGELEDGTPALAILLDIESEPGAVMDLWLSDERGPLARWSGGVDGGLPRRRVLPSCRWRARTASTRYRWRARAATPSPSPSSTRGGATILSVTRGIASFVPPLRGSPGGTEVFRDLLACP